MFRTDSLATSDRSLRRGVSIYSLITCLFAVGGGVWIGAQMMEVKVTDLAYTALDETQMLDKLPEEWRPELSECPVGECPEKDTPNEYAAALQNEFAGLQLEVAKLQQAATRGETPVLQTPEQAEELANEREQTLAYWARLCEVANQVAQLDEKVESAMGKMTSGHVFDVRRRAFDYGRRSIEALPTYDVDPRAIEAGNRLIGWYEDGTAFYEQAIVTWDSLAGAEQTPFAENTLENARVQHRKQTELLRVKLAELSSLLSRRYAAPFPAIGV
ncbi:MAG: hypothetical protein AAGF31_13710 [Planctomycetota bacterium]